MTIALPTDIGRVDWVDEIDGLTARQRILVRHLAEGLTRDEIAQSLCITCPTVKTHLRDIYKRTGCSSEAQLVRLALTGQQPDRAE